MITRIVDTGVRELRCIWTREMAQDISMYHSIDIEKELTKQLKREIRIAKIKRIITNKTEVNYIKHKNCIKYNLYVY